jgi:predicted CXXCH cytochrome family protein
VDAVRWAAIAAAALALTLAVPAAPAVAPSGTAGVALAQVPSHNCDFCHNLHGASFPQLQDYAVTEDLCFSCHGDSGVEPDSVLRDGVWVPIPKGVAIHDGPKHAQPTSCWNCHDHEGEAGSNLKLIPALLTTPNSGVRDVLFLAFTGPNSFADGDSTLTGVCEVCHTQTNYHRNTLGDPAWRQHNAAADCTTCHPHQDGFQPTAGGCTACHKTSQDNGDGVPVGGRRAIVAEFDRTSHHVQIGLPGDSVPDSDCQACHDQSRHQQGNVRLWDWNSPGDTGAAIVLTGDPATSSTEAAKLTTFCLGCHDADGANGSPPFSDNATPPALDPAAWNASSHETSAVIVGCFGDGTFGCHASGHGSEKRKLLAPPDVPATAPALAEEEEGFCFNCHDADGPASTDIAGKFAATIKWVTAPVGEFNNTELNDRHDVQYSAASTSGAKIECTSCHDPHAANASQKVIPDPDPADGRTPGEGFLTVTGGDYMTEWCLECHDDSYAPGVTAPTTTLQDIYTTVVGNRADAMGEGSGGATLKPGYGWTSGKNGNMTVPCLSCHDPHVSGNLFHAVETVMSFDGTTPVPSDGPSYAITDNNTTDQTINSYYWCNTCHTGSMGSGKTNCYACHYHGTRW